MSHVYVVTSDTAIGDQVTIVGTVDGIDVTVNCWLSALKEIKQRGGMPAVKAFVANLMLAAAQPPVPAQITELPTGTFVL